MSGVAETHGVEASPGAAYGLAGAGLFVSILAVMALTSPGRIDIVDGQTRYEVARSLVDHGDHAIRDPHIWFGRFPGRDAKDHTNYRFPQSLLGVPAVWLSDVTGGTRETRRHYFFAMTSAMAGAALAVLYFTWFLDRGRSIRSALWWAALGIVATPAWFYATSTFDDVLGTTVSVAALVAAGRPSWAPWRRATTAGLLVGLAFNCKQPLIVVALPALAQLWSAPLAWRLKLRTSALLALGASAGVLAFVAYEAYKFPLGLEAAHAVLQLQYMPVWPAKPMENAAALLLSPSAGLLWYCPPTVLGLVGLSRSDAPFRRSLAASIVVFGLFITSITIFKGDPSWGPRYFTPVYAWLWLLAPHGAAAIDGHVTRLLVVAGVLVQLAALTVDPHRLYVERNLPSMFGAVAPILYFDPQNAHLLNRPREIREIWHARDRQYDRFSPAPAPTFAFPVLDRIDRGRAVVEQFAVLNTFRPWWVSQCHLPDAARPVSIPWALAVQVALLAIGLISVRAGLSRANPPRRVRASTL
jgi:hypothetical protein